MITMPGLANIRWIYIKEIRSFFGSSFPPVSIGIVAFLCGLVSVIIALSEGATYANVTRAIFYFFYIIIIIAAVFLSMSAFVNERKQGTLELLYTLPVSETEMVLGKFFSNFSILAILSFLMTAVYILGIAEAPFYVAFSGWLGLMIVGAYAISVGIFASSLSESHLISLLVSLLIIVLIDIGGFLSGLLPSPAREVFVHLHGLSHYTPFSRGTIPLRSIVFFLSFAAAFQFLTVRVLESRRWRGL